MLQRVIALTEPDAQELLSRGRTTVEAIDREAGQIWLRIVCLVTALPVPAQALQAIAHRYPQVGSESVNASARACAQLQVSHRGYFASQVQALFGQPVAVSPEENLKYTVIGIKGVHASALTLQDALDRPGRSS